MSGLIRWTLPLVAYLCVGTVISAALGYGYLRHNGTLNDDTMFRIMAILHGLNLDEIKKEGEATVDEIPPEEESYAQQQKKLQTASLLIDAKKKQVDDSLSDFDYQLERVSEATERYARLRRDVEIYLTQQQEDLANSTLSSVRTQLEALIPQKQAKPLLIEYINDGKIDTVVLLLASMKERSRREILRNFVSKEDIEMLYQIEQHMLNDNPAKAIINGQLEELKKLKAQEK